MEYIGAMSALGQKQTFALHQPMSALPPIATSIAFFGMSALGQKRTHAAQQTAARLFDHLVGLCEQRRRHGEAERFGSDEIDRDVVPGQRLHRKIAGLFAFEDTGHVISGAPGLINRIGCMTNQTAFFDHDREGIDRGQLQLRRKRNHQFLPSRHRRGIRCQDHTAVRETGKVSNRRLNFAGIEAAVDRGQFHPERPRLGLDRAE